MMRRKVKQQNAPSPSVPVPNTYKEMLGHTCRSCINYEFGKHLRPNDVVYEKEDGNFVRRKCDYCLKTTHIVKRLKLSGKFKMRFQKI